DPVENASLIPWLFGTVLIHGLHMERTKGRYRRANYVLAALVYLSVLYGTFLTRSRYSPWISTVPNSQGISEAFSTGSQPQ
ncbi:MAG TPA: hypothetical protein VNW71_05375, partial [Thermoanaerobaculia bacterium]|nr:hypothetical protein [Thermoanaerobaculia bacterium]